MSILRPRFPIIVPILLSASCTALGMTEPAPLPPAQGSAELSLVRPGDRVALRIWNEPEMSDTFWVSESGIVTLPRLGAVEVTNKTVAELQDSLRVAYQKYLHNPSVDVVVLRRIGVTGGVRSPGLYMADLTMTIPDLIALAGGITEAGNPNDITLYRGAAQYDLGSDDRERLAMTDLQSGDQIIIGERGFIARNPLVAVSTGLTVLSVVLTQLIPALQ